jgi:hypothetical protein
VATELDEKPIEDEKLVIGEATADDPKKPLVEIAKGFAGKAPLWAYILSEAQVKSWEKADPGMAKDDIPIKLGPVGAESSPRCSPPCFVVTPRPTCAGKPRSGRSRSSLATISSASPS